MISYNSKFITYTAIVIMCYTVFTAGKSSALWKMFTVPRNAAGIDTQGSYTIKLDIANKKYADYTFTEKLVYNIFKSKIDPKLRLYKKYRAQHVMNVDRE